MAKKYRMQKTEEHYDSECPFSEDMIIKAWKRTGFSPYAGKFIYELKMSPMAVSLELGYARIARMSVIKAFIIEEELY